MWLERSRYSEYHKVKCKTLASFQILDPKEQKSAQESQREPKFLKFGK